MIATQIQALLLEVFEKDTNFKYSLRQDILAVLDRDPAVKSSTDVILYFKGFQALQTHRVSHWLWKNDRGTLALFLNSRLNSVYNIDIHPGAKLGTGILIDHGTGIVIGATAVVGNNVSMLHQVTLGGAGKVNVERHPKIQDGVLLGAGATLLGNITIGEGSNIGARSMVVDDIPPNCVVVGG
jgi:serine O-acetyltransferase